MRRFRVETGEDGTSRCSCCGARSRTVHGFVFRDDDAYAIYYGGWSDGHPDRGVSLAIAVGEWDERSTARDRTSIGIIAKPTPVSIDFRILDGKESPWGETELFGKMLDRAQALAPQKLKEALQVAELIVRNDERVRHFLESIAAL